MKLMFLIAFAQLDLLVTSGQRAQADGDTERQHDQRGHRLLQGITNLQVHGEGAQHQDGDQQGRGENQEVQPQARNQAES